MAQHCELASHASLHDSGASGLQIAVACCQNPPAGLHPVSVSWVPAAPTTDAFGQLASAARRGVLPPGCCSSYSTQQGCTCPWLQAVVEAALPPAGASGAALVDSAGRCQGLVTSNTRHSAAGSFPHWSFAIAAAELQPVVACLHQFSSSRQVVGALQRLDTDDAELRKLWTVGNLSLPLGPGGSDRKAGKSTGLQGADRLSQLVGQSRLDRSSLPAAISRM